MDVSRILEKARKTEDFYQRIRLCSQGTRVISSIIPFKQKEYLILSDLELPKNLLVSIVLAPGPVNSLIDALFYRFKSNESFLMNWVKQAEELFIWDPKKEINTSISLQKQISAEEPLIGPDYSEDSQFHSGRLWTRPNEENLLSEKLSKGGGLLNSLLETQRLSNSFNKRPKLPHFAQSPFSVRNQPRNDSGLPGFLKGKANTEARSEKNEIHSEDESTMAPEVLKGLNEIRKLALETALKALEFLKPIQKSIATWFSLTQFMRRYMECIPFDKLEELEKAWEFFEAQSKDEKLKINRKDFRKMEKAYKRIRRKNKKELRARGVIKSFEEDQIEQRNENKISFGRPHNGLKASIGGDLSDPESDISSVDTQEKEDMKKRQADMLLKLQKKQEVQIKLETILFSVDFQNGEISSEIKQSFEANPLYTQTLIEFLVKPFALKVEEAPGEGTESFEEFLNLNPVDFECFVGNFEKPEDSEDAQSSLLSENNRMGNRNVFFIGRNTSNSNTSNENTPMSSLGKVNRNPRNADTLVYPNGVSPRVPQTDQNEAKKGRVNIIQNKESPTKTGLSQPQNSSQVYGEGQGLIRTNTINSNLSSSLRRGVANSKLQKTMSPVSGTFGRFSLNPKANSKNNTKIKRRLTINSHGDSHASFEAAENEVIFRTFRVYQLLVNEDNFKFFSGKLKKPIQSSLMGEFTDVLTSKLEESKVIVPFLIKVFEFFAKADPREFVHYSIGHNLFWALLPSIHVSLVSSFILALLSPSDSLLNLEIQDKMALWDSLKNSSFFFVCGELLLNPKEKKKAFSRCKKFTDEAARRKSKRKNHSRENLDSLDRLDRSDSGDFERTRCKTMVFSKGKRKGSDDQMDLSAKAQMRNKFSKDNTGHYSQVNFDEMDRILEKKGNSKAPDIDLIETTLSNFDTKKKKGLYFSSGSLTSLNGIKLGMLHEKSSKRQNQRRLTCKDFTLFPVNQRENKKEELRSHIAKAERELELIKTDMSLILYPDNNKYRDHPVFSMPMLSQWNSDEYSLAIADFLKAIIENLVNFKAPAPFLPFQIPPAVLDFSIIDALFQEDGKAIDSLFRSYLLGFNSSFSKGLSVSVSLVCGEAANMLLKYFKALQRKLGFSGNQAPKPKSIGSFSKVPDEKPAEGSNGENHSNQRMQRCLRIAKSIAFFYFHLVQKLIIEHHLNWVLKKSTEREKLGSHRLVLVETYLGTLDLDSENECICFVTPRCLHVLMSWAFIFNQNNILIRLIGKVFNVLIVKGEEFTLADILVRLNIGSIFQRVYSIHDNLKVVPTFELLFLLVDEIVKCTFEKLEGAQFEEFLKRKIEEKNPKDETTSRRTLLQRGATDNRKYGFEKKKTFTFGERAQEKNGSLIFDEETQTKRKEEESQKENRFIRKLRARMTTKIVKKASEDQEESEKESEKMKELREFIRTSKCWEFLKEKVYDLPLEKIAHETSLSQIFSKGERSPRTNQTLKLETSPRFLEKINEAGKNEVKRPSEKKKSKKLSEKSQSELDLSGDGGFEGFLEGKIRQISGKKQSKTSRTKHTEYSIDKSGQIPEANQEGADKTTESFKIRKNIERGNGGLSMKQQLGSKKRGNVTERLPPLKLESTSSSTTLNKRDLSSLDIHKSLEGLGNPIGKAGDPGKAIEQLREVVGKPKNEKRMKLFEEKPKGKGFVSKFIQNNSKP